MRIAILTAATLRPLFSAQVARPDQTPLRVAVVGVGGMGRHHARIIRGLAGADLAAVVDVSPARANLVATEFECAAYGSVEELLDRAGVDAVTLAVPTVAHHNVAMSIIERGVPLLIEKPIAATVAEGRALVAAAAARSVMLAVGHIERFNPAVRELRRSIAAGDLGNVLAVSARRVGILAPELSQTSVIVDLAVHDIDVVRFLLQIAPTVRGAISGRAWDRKHNDWADLLLAYGPVACAIHVNWVTPVKIRTLSVTGSRGYAELNYVTQHLDVYQAETSHESVDFEEFVKRYGQPVRRAIPVRQEEPLAIELRSFVDSVRHGTPPEVDGTAGLSALEVAEEAARLASASEDARPH